MAGFFDYSVHYNHILDQVTLTNEVIVVKKEFRSLRLMGIILDQYKRIANEMQVDVMNLAFDNTEKPEAKRKLALRLGYSEFGRTIYKLTDKKSSSTLPSKNKFRWFSLQSYKYFAPVSACGYIYLALYLFTLRRLYLSAKARGLHHRELLEHSTRTSYFLAKIEQRKYDGVKHVIVDAAYNIGAEELDKINTFAVEQDAKFILLSLIGTRENIAETFPNYESYGFSLAGYNLSRTAPFR